MQIVDRKTFLAMPVGTVYSKMPLDGAYDFGPVEIKGETSGENDWYVQRLIGDFIGANDTAEWIDAIDEMKRGLSRTVDYDIQGRDALYDADQLFAVFHQSDLLNLIERLTKALRGAE